MPCTDFLIEGCGIHLLLEGCDIHLLTLSPPSFYSNFELLFNLFLSHEPSTNVPHIYVYPSSTMNYINMVAQQPTPEIQLP